MSFAINAVPKNTGINAKRTLVLYMFQYSCTCGGFKLKLNLFWKGCASLVVEARVVLSWNLFAINLFDKLLNIMSCNGTMYTLNVEFV